MAFPLMAIGAGVGQAIDSINQQRQQRQQQQLAMLRMQFEMQRFNQEMEAKKQELGLQQQAAINPFASLVGGGGGTSGMPLGGGTGGFGMGAPAPGAPSSFAPPPNVSAAPQGQGGNMQFGGGLSLGQMAQLDPYDRLIAQDESNFRNVPNYRYDPTHTAGGFFQQTNTNWRKYGNPAYPNAMAAPFEEQLAAERRQRAAEGLGPWANFNPRLSRDLTRLGPQAPAAPAGFSQYPSTPSPAPADITAQAQNMPAASGSSGLESDPRAWLTKNRRWAMSNNIDIGRWDDGSVGPINTETAEPVYNAPGFDYSGPSILNKPSGAATSVAPSGAASRSPEPGLARRDAARLPQQFAQADTGTLSDAGPPLPRVGDRLSGQPGGEITSVSPGQTRERPPPQPQYRDPEAMRQETIRRALGAGYNPQLAQYWGEQNAKAVDADNKFKRQRWEDQMREFDERYKEGRDQRADAAAARAGDRLEDAVDAQGNPTKIWVKPDGSVAQVRMPEGVRFPAKTGRAATGHFGDVNDLMDRWHQDFVSQNNREPTTAEIATQHAKLSQSIRPAGQLAQNMAERIMIGGNDAAKSVAAMSKLGPGATLGLFGGAQATLGPGLIENIKKNLANAVTPTSAQVLKSFSNGVGRALAMLMSGGSSQGVQQFSQMLANDVPQANDDGYTILSKYADIRDIADASLEVLRTDPRLTADQHKQVDEIMAKIQKAVPFNREDVAALVAERSAPTIAEFAQKMGFKGAGGGPAAGAVEDGYRFKGGDPADQKNWEKVQ